MHPLSSTSSIRRPRTLGLLIAAILVGVASYVATGLRSGGSTGMPGLTAPMAAAAPSAPLSLSGSDAPAPGTTSVDGGGAPAGSLAQIDHSIDAWSKNLETNPKDFLAATNLAVLYQGRGRLTYDLGDYERALTAAQTALRIEPHHAPARLADAAIMYSLHDFAGAYAGAEALLREDPTQVAALATRFDAELELGRIDDARVDLRRLSTNGGPGVLIREARLDSVTGHPTDAVVKAQAARKAAVDDEVDDLGFYAYAVGEYARLAGDPTTARAAYKDALAIRDSDLGALVGLARIDAFDDRMDDAIAGLQRATAIAPQPEALALFGDLLATRGDAGARESYDTVRFIERLGDIQASTFDRQLLRFELDHGGASDDVLARARASEAGRPDSSGHDIVGWALYRLGRYDQAAASIEAARALGADDARLRFHDGAIRLARGDVGGGTLMLRSALALGPALDPTERAEASTLLGE